MLYDILRRRPAVNALKQLVDGKNTVDSSALSLANDDLDSLAREGLIHRDRNLIAPSLKGKQFVKLLDELKSLTETPVVQQARVSFSLSPEERQVLLQLSKLGGHANGEMLLALLKQDAVINTRRALSSLLSDLQELNLVKLDKKSVEITELGRKTIMTELLDEYKLK
jgi:predicted methyltransferase